jgi:N-carbamoyl-L-amino-acid hydrolase
MHNLKTDAARLWDSLMTTAAIGGTAKGGICRLTLSEHDKTVRSWLQAQVEALGCTVLRDDMGVMFARRAAAHAGNRADVPPIAIGSHMDTQPTGGKFDGNLGVLAALEVLRTLNEAGYETFAPIELVNWTNEEGARFSPPMLASGVFAGVFARDWACGRADADGVSFGAALEAIGERGGEACGQHPLSAFFELHIEQGPILEAEGFDIGAVTGVQGMRWFEVTVTGQEAHTGATPMHLRKNALLGAARLVEKVEAIARAHAPFAVTTVGSMRVKPNSPNVVPGEVFLTVDLRHPETAVLDLMEGELHAAFDAACEPLDLGVGTARIWDQHPVAFDPRCVAAVRRAAERSGFKVRDMVSGAGHDAAYLARVTPTAMIFVPCRGGISHNEAEFSSQEQCAAGAQVLLQAVLDYDRRLAERHT